MRLFLPPALAAVMIVAPTIACAQIIDVEAPLERSVLQRSAADDASVALRGRCPIAVDLLEVRAVLHPAATKGLGTGWKPLGVAGGRFDGLLRLSAGGWYRLEVRAKQSKKVVAQAIVERVGVGDVFVTAGQSNSANFGTVPRVATDDRVVYFTGNAYRPAKDPIPGSFGTGGSPWPLLGDIWARNAQVPTCFRGATPDYTTVAGWQPGTGNYRNLLAEVHRFGDHGVRAVLWHQGESDAIAHTSAQQYRERLETIIRSMRKDVGYELDWFVAAAAFHATTHATPQFERAVVDGQKLIWKDGVAFPGAATDDLGLPFRAADATHFNERGLQAHADRWFASLWTHYSAESSITKLRKTQAQR